MSALTPDELKFLEKRQKQREQQAKRQSSYRERKQATDPSYKDNYNQYMKDYNQKQKEKEQLLKGVIIKAPLITIQPPNDLIKSVEVPKVDKRTRRGKQQAKAPEIKPSFENRQEPLKLTTLETYLRQIIIIHKKFKNKDLSQEVKAELRKLFNYNTNIDETKIINEMEYLKDANLILTTVKEHYPNANSFKTYLNIIVVVLSHLKTLNKVYQTLTGVNKNVNKEIQEQRDENTLTDEEKTKIIDFDRPTIISNMEKITNLKEKLIFALYTLQPPRRLEYRKVKITTNNNIDDLNNENYLIISETPKKFIFNDYKTSGAYKQNITEVKDELLNNIIDKYIALDKRKENEYLISTDKDKRQVIEQSNFSNLLSKVFYKAYRVKTNLDYIRKSAIINFLKVPRTNKEKKEFAEAMSHSIEEQSKYYKIL